MTVTEFLEVLRPLAPNAHLRKNGSIRISLYVLVGPGKVKLAANYLEALGNTPLCFCPITAVCLAKQEAYYSVGSYTAAAQRLGMDELLAGQVALASDHSTYPGLRRQIIKALGGRRKLIANRIAQGF